MDKPPTPTSPADALAGALDWWREAGVDSDFAEKPTKWLANPETVAGERPNTAPVAALPPPTPEIPPIGGERAGWPASLEEFAAWWTGLTDLPGSAPAIAPRGAPGADLMVVVTMPEAEDRERLLSARQGELVANMLRAMRIGAERAYLASALPRHAGHPDWQGLAGRDLGKVLMHHIGLVAPKRLLLLGREMLPLFGHDPAQQAANSPQIALESLSVPALVSFDVETLLQQPRFRKTLWQGWLEWTEGSQ